MSAARPSCPRPSRDADRRATLARHATATQPRHGRTVHGSCDRHTATTRPLRGRDPPPPPSSPPTPPPAESMRHELPVFARLAAGLVSGRTASAAAAACLGIEPPPLRSETAALGTRPAAPSPACQPSTTRRLHTPTTAEPRPALISPSSTPTAPPPSDAAAAALQNRIRQLVAAALDGAEQDRITQTLCAESVVAAGAPAATSPAAVTAALEALEASFVIYRREQRYFLF